MKKGCRKQMDNVLPLGLPYLVYYYLIPNRFFLIVDLKGSWKFLYINLPNQLKIR